MNLPTLLVITTEVGEPQLLRASAALAQQRGVEWERVLLSGLSMQEAHAAVHAQLLDAAGKYDWVLKLDGDMVPSRPSALREIIDRAAAAGSPIRYTEPVLDWYTGLQIEGVHLLQPRDLPACVDVSPPFHDQWIEELPSVKCRQLASPAILHAPDASLEQGLRFGLQRGLKARVQGPRGGHWHRIQELKRHWRRTRHPVLLGALAGVAIGLGVHRDVPSDENMVDQASADFAALLHSLVNEPELAARFAAPLTRPMGVWRAHYCTCGSGPEVLRALAAGSKRRLRYYASRGRGKVRWGSTLSG